MTRPSPASCREPVTSGRRRAAAGRATHENIVQHTTKTTTLRSSTIDIKFNSNEIRVILLKAIDFKLVFIHHITEHCVRAFYLPFVFEVQKLYFVCVLDYKTGLVWYRYSTPDDKRKIILFINR